MLGPFTRRVRARTPPLQRGEIPTNAPSFRRGSGDQRAWCVTLADLTSAYFVAR
jgi:hypothetical protein